MFDRTDGDPDRAGDHTQNICAVNGIGNRGLGAMKAAFHGLMP